MGDAVDDFFRRLEERGHEIFLGGTNGVLRLDLRGDGGVDHWTVEFSGRDVRVSRESGPADCVVSGDRSVFEGMVLGRVSGMAGWLRNDLTCEGSLELLRYLATAFPTPPGARDPRPSLRYDWRRGERENCACPGRKHLPGLSGER